MINTQPENAPRPRFYLYGKETCHLCHDMWAQLRLIQNKNNVAFEIIWQDIEDDASLEEQYGWRIPILITVHDVLICEGRLDESAFMQALQNLQTSSES